MPKLSVPYIQTFVVGRFSCHTPLYMPKPGCVVYTHPSVKFFLDHTPFLHRSPTRDCVRHSPLVMILYTLICGESYSKRPTSTTHRPSSAEDSCIGVQAAQTASGRPPPAQPSQWPFLPSAFRRSPIAP